MRRSLLAVLALAPLAAGAQGLTQTSLRIAPQGLYYKLDAGGAETSIMQLAIPVALVVPLTSSISFDVATAFANVNVDAGNTESKLSGLTDTQLRFNYTLGTDAVVVTAGLNLPTGQYEVEQDKITAAGQIGNDFLAFPVSSFGNGFAGTGGVAVARSLGGVNLGLGGSFRKSWEFGAYGSDANALRFEPANEIRLRGGIDGFALGGRLMAGAVFSMFGEDGCEGCEPGASRTTYSTGNRIILQAAADMPAGPVNLFVSTWYLNRAEGEQIGGPAPPETIMNFQAALGLNLGLLFLEPSVEFRRATSDGEAAGNLTFFGVRTRFGMGPLEVSPSVAFGTGKLDQADADITGFKGGLTIRVN
jgi:hypothetical protein